MEQTRAQLLEACKAAGLRATGWDKGRLAAELERLAQPAEPGPEEKPEDEPEEPRRRRRAATRSGWCQDPIWAEGHADCPGGGGGGEWRRWACPCECHAEGFARPDAPEGARQNDLRGLPRSEMPGVMPAGMDPHTIHLITKLADPGCPDCQAAPRDTIQGTTDAEEAQDVGP